MATKIARLLFTRKRLLRSIEVQTTAIDAFTAETATAIQLSRKEALETLWTEFKDNSDAIESTRDWVGDDDYLNEFEQIHEKYMAALVKLLETMPEQTDTLQQSLTSLRHVRPRHFTEETIHDSTENGSENLAQAMSTSNNNHHGGIPPYVKLSPLQIRQFSGNAIDWPEFKAICDSTFKNIADEVWRFKYLKSHLSDQPYRLVKHLPLLAGSYERAIDLLEKRYDNQRGIINSSLKQVMQLPKLRSESATGLKHMVDTTNECITTLNGYKINTDSWSCILTYLLTQRLDPTSIRHWEEKLQGNYTIPPFSEFIEFLMTRINVIENTSRAEPNDADHKREKTFVNMERAKKCNICPNDSTHFTYTCPQLLGHSPSEREQFVKGKGLCVNCLHFHKVEDCTSRFSCKICEKRHNSVLHFAEKIYHIAAKLII